MTQFYNLASLRATALPINCVVETRGFAKPGDGGGALYRIVEAESDPEWNPNVTYEAGSIVTTGRGLWFHYPFAWQRWQAKVSIAGWPGYWDENVWEYLGISQRLGEPAFITLPNGNVAELLSFGQLRPEQFGAKADGITDDYAALRALSAYASSLRQGIEIQMPRGRTIQITTQNQRHTSVSIGGLNGYIAHPLWFEDIEDLRIVGNGCTIRQPGGYTTKYFSSTEGTLDDYLYPFSGLKFANCKRVEVRDLTLDGGARTLERGIDPCAIRTDTNECIPRPHVELDSHGLDIQGVYTMAVRNVNCIGFISDGILLDAHEGKSQRFHNDGIWRTRNSTNIEIEDTHCDFNQRQGMSVTGARRCVFRRCSFTNTTKGSYGGHSPGAGVDIERDRWVGDPGDGISAALPPDQNVGELLFEDCTSKANGRAFVCGYQTHEYVRLRRCFIYGDPDPGNEYDIEISSPNTFIEDCYFETYRRFVIDSAIPENDLRMIRLDRCEVQLLIKEGESAPLAGIFDLQPFGGDPNLGHNIHLYDCLIRSYVPNYGVARLFAGSGRIERCEFWRSKEAWDDSLPYNFHTSLGSAESKVVFRDCKFTSDMPPRLDNKRWIITFSWGGPPDMSGMITDSTVIWPGDTSPPSARVPHVSTGSLISAAQLAIGSTMLTFADKEPTCGYWGVGSRIFDTSGRFDRWQCIRAGFAADTEWLPEIVVNKGDIRYFQDRVYEVLTTGTTNSSPPTLMDFNTDISNGTAILRYLGLKAIFTVFP